MATLNTEAIRAKLAAARGEQAKAVESTQKVFFGEMTDSVSFITPRGTPVYFYKGYHVTEDPEVIEFCSTLKDVVEVTEHVKLEDVPRPPIRTRQRNWASSEPTMISPQELLARVVTSRDVPQAAESNGS